MADLHATYANALVELAKMTSAQVEDVFRSLVVGKPDKDTAALLKSIPPIVDQFGLAAGDVAASYYDEARDAAGVPSGYFATPAGVAEAAQVDAALRWAVGPLWAAAPDIEAALKQVLGSSERLALQPGRQTIIGAASSDRVKVGWARSPEPGACGFCLMLASRGAMYASKSAASIVGGRSIVDPSTRTRHADGTTSRQGRRGGAKIRRSHQSIGGSYHDHCRCTPTPIFEDQPVPEINTRLQQVWRDNKRGMTDEERQQALVDAFSSWS